MKKIIPAFLILFSFFISSCRQQADHMAKVQDPAATGGNDIEVYYFHMTVRCATCLAIESEARKNVEMLYPGEISSGKITFTSLNLDEEGGRAIGDQFDVKGQTLIIVSGDKESDITREAFQYAEGEPVMFASVIKEKIDSLLMR